ncbi:hypothetical protein [Cupriavidus sp. CuC1]|uniref:hypothetical protein n=1 Tax=Cupriavidus sp. CuC1 TaxID=3373131 RepID=UPI0037D844A9
MLRNPYKVLLGLLPDPPLQVGTVSAVSNGVATITMPGGGIAQARGNAAVNDHVFFRNGVIEGLAPSLPITLIDV